MGANSRYKNVGDKLPPLGVPLMVKSYEGSSGTEYVNYPVYYIQDPYEKVPCWYFFSACDGIVKLPEEGTKIIAWKKIF